MMISYRTILVVLFLSIVSAGTLVAQNYSIDVLSGTYADLTDPVELSSGTIREQHYLDIPFSFRPFGLSYGFDRPNNSALIVRDGFVASENLEGRRVWACDAFLAHMEGRDETSSMSYLLDGAGEDQVLKFQWKNMKLTGNPAGDFVNVQLWLYRKDGVFEVRIGPNKITSRVAFENATGPSIGYLIATPQFDTVFSTAFLIGSPTQPSVDRQVPLNYLAAVPTDGTIYRFHKNSSSGVELVSSERRIAFHPNPATGHTRITLPPDMHGRETTLTLYDMLGRMAYSGTIADGSSVAVGDVPPGLYHAVIGSGEERRSAGKLIVR